MSVLASVFWPGHCLMIGFVVSVIAKAETVRETSGAVFQKDFGTANGNRTRILALKGLRANRCTIAASDEMRPHNYTGNTWNLHPTMALERSAISALDLNAGQP